MAPAVFVVLFLDAFIGTRPLQVQRVPSNSQRLHTSAASVVVMMEAEDVDLKLEQRLGKKAP